MSTGCEFFADALIERAAGTLDRERNARLSAHLAECPDCTAALATVATLRASPLEVPPGLEARIRSAVREAARPAVQPADAMAAPPRGSHARWRSWALPLAAAAALVVLWIGIGLPDGGDTLPDASFPVFEGYEPYGAWPADGLIIAGEPLLSELSVEELERLLQELES
jgi:anti-sigma factor RsiW